MRKRSNVRAVWDDDLVGLLQSLGVLDMLIEGQIRCAVCDRNVDLDNLGALFGEDEEVQVTCDLTNCVRAATSREATLSSG